MKTQKLWFGLFAVFAILVLAIATVKADTDNTNTTKDTNGTDDINKSFDMNKGKAIEVRYEHLGCKLNFTKDQLDLFNKYLNDSSLDDLKRVMDNDLEELQRLADEKNQAAFDDFIAHNVTKDFANSTAKLNELKSKFHTYNFSNDTRKEIQSGLKDAKAQYTSCISDKQEKMAKILIYHMELWTKKQDMMIEKMHKRGLSTEAIENITKQINSSRQLLEQKIDSGDFRNMGDFMKEVQENNMRFWAKSEKSKLDAYVDKMEPMAKQYGKEEQVKKMKDNLKELNKYTEPGYNYSDDDAEKVHSIMKETSQDLKNTSKEILKQQIEERQRERQKKASGQPDAVQEIKQGNGKGPRGSD